MSPLSSAECGAQHVVSTRGIITVMHVCHYLPFHRESGEDHGVRGAVNTTRRNILGSDYPTKLVDIRRVLREQLEDLTQILSQKHEY